MNRLLSSWFDRCAGIREQRVTAVLISVCIGLSTIITPVLALIPMPVLFGVFLFMGVSSLKGLQFFDRLLLIFIPRYESRKCCKDFPCLFLFLLLQKIPTRLRFSEVCPHPPRSYVHDNAALLTYRPLGHQEQPHDVHWIPGKKNPYQLYQET